MRKPKLLLGICAGLWLCLNPGASHAAATEHHGHAAEQHDHAPEHHGHAATIEVDSKQNDSGALGSYPMNRDASGTSWQPDSTPHQGWHGSQDGWNLMAHGFVNGIFDDQDGPRGDDKAFSSSMAMLMGQRKTGERGLWSLRGMISLDALMGARGYPLLFATGETADGREHLVDRQHPHDLFMELATSYAYRFTKDSSVFLYAGLPGEPALGPTVFMHRFSGMDNPEAPITHHWLDSTHVTFGVVTLGVAHGPWKVEASGFNGREPNQHRYDIETPKLDSASTRLTYNPDPNWSMQASWGYLHSPEQLAPQVEENRLTASATYNLPFEANNWASTFAWGRKMNDPGQTLDGFLLESSLTLDGKHTFFGRAERADESELFDEHDENHAHQVETVNKFSIGYVRDFRIAEHLSFGAGGLVSRYAIPDGMKDSYGKNLTSYMLFVRLKVI